MTENSDLPNELEQKQFALLKILRATLTLPAQVTLYATALGAIFLVSGVSLPSTLSLIASGVGANALSNILERIARGESVSNDEIVGQVQAAIEESSVANKLQANETQVMIAKLFRQCDVLKFAVESNEFNILQRIEQQAKQFDTLNSELHDDFSEIRNEIRKIATQDQAHKIIELQELQLHRMGQIESLLKQHLPVPSQVSQLDRVALSTRAHHQVTIAESEMELSKNSANSDQWLKQAKAYYNLEDIDKAIIAINRAWEFGHQDVEVKSIRGCILAEYAIAHKGPRSMFYEAIELFNSLRGAGIHLSSIEYNIGNCFAGLNDHQEAIVYFDRALGENPPKDLAAQIWKNRGTSYFHLGNHEEEFSCYKKALELDSNLFEAYASWAATELRRNDFQHARDLLEDAFKTNPEQESSSASQLYSLAYALWRLGELEKAYWRINQALSLQPSYQDSLLLKMHLLTALWRKNKDFISDAVKFIESWIVDHPDDDGAISELYLIYDADDQRMESRAALERFALLTDASAEALYQYAMVLEREGKEQESVLYLENAFRKNQDHHIVHALARLNRKIGDYPSAIEFYKLALRDVSNPLGIFHSIANCYHSLERYRDCVSILATAIIVEPRDKDSWNNLCFSLHVLNKDGLFSIFLYYIHKLGKRIVSDEEAEAAVDELISRLSVDFGDEFVDAIRQAAAPYQTTAPD
jgi:tetratricopeptide (TPR) repeat protein